ncbi:hypothetical protein HKX48_006100 [Thoreauomyces humboldtii]|nr:hypothetical protein HKX48_006100 [Thoreauomyces humboldtii]
MYTEISTAVTFLTKLLHSKSASAVVTADHLAAFQQALVERMLDNFRGHWDPQRPCLGNGFRALCIQNGGVDAVVAEAVKVAGIRMAGEFPKWRAKRAEVFLHGARSAPSPENASEASRGYPLHGARSAPSPEIASEASRRFLHGAPSPEMASEASRRFLRGSRINGISPRFCRCTDLTFPTELVLWIDPHCVSYRIGDFGNVVTVWENKQALESESVEVPFYFKPNHRTRSPNFRPTAQTPPPPMNGQQPQQQQQQQQQQNGSQQQQPNGSSPPSVQHPHYQYQKTVMAN